MTTNRTTCPACDAAVALYPNGTFRKHGHRVFAAGSGTFGCPMSRRLPADAPAVLGHMYARATVAAEKARPGYDKDRAERLAESIRKRMADAVMG